MLEAPHWLQLPYWVPPSIFYFLSQSSQPSESKSRYVLWDRIYNLLAFSVHCSIYSSTINWFARNISTCPLVLPIHSLALLALTPNRARKLLVAIPISKWGYLRAYRVRVKIFWPCRAAVLLEEIKLSTIVSEGCVFWLRFGLPIVLPRQFLFSAFSAYPVSTAPSENFQQI